MCMNESQCYNCCPVRCRLMERNEHLTQESAEILAVRGTAPVENGMFLKLW